MHDWDELLKLKHVKLCLTRNAHNWPLQFETEYPLVNNQYRYRFGQLKQEFLKTFGKSWIDYDLKDKFKLTVIDDPMGYVFHMLQFLNETTPGGNEQSQINHLFSNLPIQIKRRMVVNMPKTIAEFIEQLKDFVRENKYTELSKFENEKVSNSINTAIQDLCQTIQTFQIQMTNSNDQKRSINSRPGIADNSGNRYGNMRNQNINRNQKTVDDL